MFPLLREGGSVKTYSDSFCSDCVQIYALRVVSVLDKVHEVCAVVRQLVRPGNDNLQASHAMGLVVRRNHTESLYVTRSWSIRFRHSAHGIVCRDRTPRTDTRH